MFDSSVTLAVRGASLTQSVWVDSFLRVMGPKQHCIPISNFRGLSEQGSNMFSTMMDSSLLVTSSGEVFSLLLAVCNSSATA